MAIGISLLIAVGVVAALFAGVIVYGLRDLRSKGDEEGEG